MPKYAAKFQARFPFEIAGDGEAEVKRSQNFAAYFKCNVPKYAAKFQARVPFEIVGDEEAEVNGPQTLRHSLNASVFHLRLPWTVRLK